MTPIESSQLDSRRSAEDAGKPGARPRYDDIVSVTGLVKYFGRTAALDGLDLSVRRGEIHGVLGPGGAGKTTLIKMLLGLLHPDAGQVRVLGAAPWRDAAVLNRRIACVQGEVSLWPNMTGGDVIDLTARMHGGVWPRKRDELIGLLELDPTKQGHTYSKYERQKVALVAALASGAEVLLLDEPTAGLDDSRQEALREWLDRDRCGGRTVVLTSHVLSELEPIADRLSIVDRGRTVASGTLRELRHLTRTSIVAELERPERMDAALKSAHNFEIRRNTVRCDVDSDQLGDVLRGLLACGVRSLTSRPPTLEELLLRAAR
jgi:ABC-2 type transport system ATP-binding protein